MAKVVASTNYLREQVAAIKAKLQNSEAFATSSSPTQVTGDDVAITERSQPVKRTVSLVASPIQRRSTFPEPSPAIPRRGNGPRDAHVTFGQDDEAAYRDFRTNARPPIARGRPEAPLRNRLHEQTLFRKSQTLSGCSDALSPGTKQSTTAVLSKVRRDSNSLLPGQLKRSLSAEDDQLHRNAKNGPRELNESIPLKIRKRTNQSRRLARGSPDDGADESRSSLSDLENSVIAGSSPQPRSRRSSSSNSNGGPSEISSSRSMENRTNRSKSLNGSFFKSTSSLNSGPSFGRLSNSKGSSTDDSIILIEDDEVSTRKSRPTALRRSSSFDLDSFPQRSSPEVPTRAACFVASTPKNPRRRKPLAIGAPRVTSPPSPSFLNNNITLRESFIETPKFLSPGLKKASLKSLMKKPLIWPSQCYAKDSPATRRLRERGFLNGDLQDVQTAHAAIGSMIAKRKMPKNPTEPSQSSSGRTQSSSEGAQTPSLFSDDDDLVNLLTDNEEEANQTVMDEPIEIRRMDQMMRKGANESSRSVGAVQAIDNRKAMVSIDQDQDDKSKNSSLPLPAISDEMSTDWGEVEILKDMQGGAMPKGSNAKTNAGTASNDNAESQMVDEEKQREVISWILRSSRLRERVRKICNQEE